MKFNHGQRVTCTIDGTKIIDAKISIDPNGEIFICQNVRSGTDANNKMGYLYSWRLTNDFMGVRVSDLKPAEKTFDSPSIGDEYKTSRGGSRFVLGSVERVIIMSSLDDKDSGGQWFTKEELIKNGYTIVQDTPLEEIEEVTMEDVCKKFGKEVKIKK